MERLINIGCGATYHRDWINLDVVPADPEVLPIDINKGLPFPSGYAAVCYSSHVLEHLEKRGAASLISECFRVLRNGGVIRLAVPNLESLAREYLRVLDAVGSGDRTRERDYDWILHELYDQAVRNYSGGEMATFLMSLQEKDRAYVRSRIGAEADGIWNIMRNGERSRGKRVLHKMKSWRQLMKSLRIKLAGVLVYLVAGEAAYKSFQTGIFRNSGEVHQWMYDRYSLKRLLEQAGFVNVTVCGANESRIPGFEKYALDASAGVVRKPDSIFVEASKP